MNHTVLYFFPVKLFRTRDKSAKNARDIPVKKSLKNPRKIDESARDKMCPKKFP